jgi:peroxiredoxin
MKIRLALLVIMAVAAVAPPSHGETLTEPKFRQALGFKPDTRLLYRDPDCRPIAFKKFSELMAKEGAHAQPAYKPSGGEVTITVAMKGTAACPAAYGPLQSMPLLSLPDLAGMRVTSASLRGKPTLVSYFFVRCVPCVKEVGPLNAFRTLHPDINTLAVTFDTPTDTRDFVSRYRFEWRVLPLGQDFIDRSGITRYPTLVLFDSQGRVLGTKMGGAVTDRDVAGYLPKLEAWVQELLAPRP